MVQKSVVVFSSHNIYTEGVVSRLRQHPDSGEIHFIDAKNQNFIDKVVALKPSVVILDAIESDQAPCCLLCELLTALPLVTIIRLKVHRKDVQVVSGSTHVLEDVADLINLIWREER